MTGIENLADPSDVKGYRNDLAGVHEHFFVKTFAIPQSLRIIDDQDGPSIRIDITDANNHVGIWSR